MLATISNTTLLYTALPICLTTELTKHTFDKQLTVIFLCVFAFIAFRQCVWNFVRIEKLISYKMPSPVNDPLVLLTNKGERQPNFLSTIYNPAACAAAGCGLAMILNWAFRRPVFSGIQKHIALTALGGFAGVYIDKKRTEALATRDAVLRHYVELHPEDFPVVERKKFADVLEKWVPIR